MTLNTATCKALFTTNSIYRASELEIENEKIRKDVLLLRNSVNRGIAEKELEGKEAISALSNHFRSCSEKTRLFYSPMRV